MEQTDRNCIEVYTNGKTKSLLSPSLFSPSQISPSGRGGRGGEGGTLLLYSPLCGDGLASHLLCWGTGHFHRTSIARGRKRGETGVCIAAQKRDNVKLTAMQNNIHTAPLLTHKLVILFPWQSFITCCSWCMGELENGASITSKLELAIVIKQENGRFE